MPDLVTPEEAHERIKRFNHRDLTRLTDHQLQRGYRAIAATYTALPAGSMQEAMCMGWMQQWEAEITRRQEIAR